MGSSGGPGASEGAGGGTHVSNGGPNVGRDCEWPLGSGTGQAFLLQVSPTHVWRYRIDEQIIVGRSELCAQSFQSLLTSSDHDHEAEQKELCIGCWPRGYNPRVICFDDNKPYKSYLVLIGVQE